MSRKIYRKDRVSGKSRMSGEKVARKRNRRISGISAGKPPGRAESVQKTERIGTKRQCVTTGTERIPRVETQAAGCSGTHRRIKSGERNPPRNGEAYPFYRENPQSGRRTTRKQSLVRRPLRGWFLVCEDFLVKRRRAFGRQ